MQTNVLPLLLFAILAAGVGVGMYAAGLLFGPKRNSRVKEMPYESGMDPIHDTHRRFDVRFHLVAIAFLVFDVELLFLYPWAVASRAVPAEPTAEPQPIGIDYAVAQGWVADRHLVFCGVLAFLALVVLGFVYDWKKGLFRWH